MLPDWSAGTGAAPPHGSLTPRIQWVERGSSPASAVVVVHGRGGSADGILELSDHIGSPSTAESGVLWVAPQAAGQSWYPYSFLAPVQRNEPGRTSGLDVLGRIVDGIEAAGIPRQRILMGGFSQGACLALEFAGHLAAPLGGVFALSGGLIGPPGELRHYTGSVAGMPVFMGCSDNDPHIPADRVHESAAIMEGLGARVDVRIYDGMGHTVNRDELEAISGLLDGVARRQSAGSDGRSGS